jgi:hypothetical protein
MVGLVHTTLEDQNNDKFYRITIMEPSAKTVYENLEQVDRVDTFTSATYRQSAQEVLANPEVSLDMREAIADRLHEANHELTIHAPDDDSY